MADGDDRTQLDIANYTYGSLRRQINACVYFPDDYFKERSD